MEKSKSQIILLDKNGLETVAKALSSGCWTLNDSGNLEIGGSVGTSSTSCGSAPQLTFAQGNVRPVTQVSGNGGSANSTAATVLERTPTFQRDNSQVATLTELGKKLIVAAREGNTNQVRRLMAIGAPFAADGPVGMTPLHLAAQNGHYSTCDRLLCAGMNKDAKNKVDKTPLHLAAMEGHYNIVLLLVRHGASLNACDMLKMTALHWACDRGHTSIAHLLLRHHAQTDIKNKFFKTPLQLAIENGHEDVAVILQRGISLKEEDEEEEGVEEEEEEEEEEEGVEEEEMAVESISLSGSLDTCSIPGVVKIEEVHTQELLVPEISESSQSGTEGSKSSQDEDIPSVGSELPHTILADELEDQNISVLATLAELAHATPRASQTTVDMSSAAALELLKAQAALLDDSSTLVSSAMAHGQTLHLTEAGQQALKLIKQEIPLLPTNTLSKDLPHVMEQEEEDANTVSSKIISKSASSSPSETLLEGSSCLPALLPPSITDVDEDDESQQVTQVITLSQEQYAALTGGTNGPIILQVLPSCEDEEELEEGSRSESPPLVKRQKVMQLVTRVAEAASRQSHAVAKVSGEVLSVDLPGVNNI